MSIIAKVVQHATGETLVERDVTDLKPFEQAKILDQLAATYPLDKHQIYTYDPDAPAVPTFSQRLTNAAPPLVKPRAKIARMKVKEKSS